MKNRVLVFDLDDTLYKEIDFLRSAYLEIAKTLESQFAINGLYPFMFQAYVKGLDVFSCLINTYGLPVTKEKLLNMYRSHYPNLQLENDVENTLGVLKQKYKLGIITDGRSITQRNKFQTLGLSRFIDEDNLIISEEFGSEKPSERNYLFFQKKFIDSDFVYIGDNLKKDFITPNRLGWKTICLLDDGRNIHKQNFDCIEPYLPHLRIYRLKDLLSCLD